MDRKPFYREQAEKFRDFADKNPGRDLLSLFDEWAESKDIQGVDKHEIWRRARRLKPNKEIILGENSEGFVSISAVLDILLQNDLAYLNKEMDRQKESK
ncbi:MAG: hypothetical protein V1886_03895 [archaeon]